MLYCVTDIGSNTVKCNIYEYNGKEPKLISFRGKRLGLISKIKDGILPSEDINELCELVNKFKTELDQTKNPVFYCFATQALRIVSNLDDIKSALSNIGVELDLISGEEEAKLSFSGFISKHNINSALTVDMGGASTELVCCKNGILTGVESFPFGCLYLRHEYVKSLFPTESEQHRIYDTVFASISAFDWIENNPLLGLVGGTANAIKKLLMYFGEANKDRYSIEAFTALIDKIASSPQDYESIFGDLIAERTDTVLPGAIAYKAIADYSGAKEILISTGGVRDGYLLQKLGENK